ncbi:YbhB/YbcL family Raf kinase inhibitor-like protein [Candidatus Kaiserbacteria bacterium CG10_big_fil_rev_8_21_14_0_10_45_20]|uniref:YbhB/YbcL family Raf kinase inhibitor-like protein n=1 Tax=Candidatus Kaiserbacteria bacterium CG10_big_fil_rev_8_21_14_0_10_45_20 TaxID=1974607 RepID=A0A2H0UIK5_9BACT|nr:MAG: YbhB/YbcL family Raf kinase inhibitor-like protein [Candidatus Kaiserbacteria bacterium CG10_big_fil_rev_8_21_14_0_10_45_20]
MNIFSTAFTDGGIIPSIYTCEGGRRLSPPLTFSHIPDGTQSFVLFMDDPDVPKEVREDGHFTHWVLYNIPPTSTFLEEGTNVGVCGKNTRDESLYTGPCPPSEYEPSEHRYFFTLYALDTTLNLPEGVSKEEVQDAMQGHILEEATLMGTYKKVK